jgi:biopolymer transport protein ExbD
MKIPKRSPSAEIPTASMADIAFLLIIFFMVTTVFSATKGLEFSLPRDDKQETETETEDAVFIKVSPGSILVDCKPMGLGEILDYLEPKLTVNQEKPVVLYTVADSRYQDMISVYDVLSSAELPMDQGGRGFKVKNISIPTQTIIEEYIELFGANPFESQCQ